MCQSPHANTEQDVEKGLQPGTRCSRGCNGSIVHPLHVGPVARRQATGYASSQAAAALDDLFEHPVTYSVGVLDFFGPDFHNPVLFVFGVF